MDWFKDWGQIDFLGNTVADYAIALAAIIGGILAVSLVRKLVISRIRRWAKRTETELDDRFVRLLDRPILFLLFLGAFYIGVHNLNLHPILEQSVDVICTVLTVIILIQIVSSLVEYLIHVYWFTHRDNPGLEQTIGALMPAIKVVIWVIGLVFLLDNLGFDISAVVAGLGIGGVAVALASQGVLQDLFSYFAILFDRPFEIGDFIIVGDFIGTVEHVGIKTTHMRSISGEQLVLANTDLTSTRIRNFRRMQRRRIVFSIGVTYETGYAKIERIPAMIQAIVEQMSGVTFDRAHFLSYGDFSLNFEVVYFVETDDYTAYMDAQQQINLGLKTAFEKEQIEFAYPTQVLYLSGLETQVDLLLSVHIGGIIICLDKVDNL
ncbi:MAG: mechanosensitive ion channel family protein, partial [Cyanobacteria bacterium P01_G01_bin.38]